MKVTLRQRNKNNKTSLYLDYYHKGKRKSEYLKLYLTPTPRTKEERILNKKTKELAESIRAKRQIEIQNGFYGFDDSEKLKGDFISYLEDLKEKRRSSSGNYGNWDSMVKHFKIFHPNPVSFQEVDTKLIESFKYYLDNIARKKSNDPLAQNSKYSYFNKLRAALKQALRDGILKHNPSEPVQGFKQGEPQREFLTIEEVQALVGAKCDNTKLKTAFLFACLTGLRWSDIQKLLWSEVQHSESGGNYIRYRQKKTKGAETQPISNQARKMLGERQDPDERVFIGLKYSAQNNLKLAQWVLRAGITKTITFHCSRHTYATLQLSLGTDIYTVSKLLGHRELKTTQIYAQIIDDKKQEAANRIQLDL
ncbi:MAG: site-specific integrase [Bacteroidetes bacterium]|nr:MAG: site-specific integrase [Bacteroidota bacterium]